MEDAGDVRGGEIGWWKAGSASTTFISEFCD